MRPGGRRRVRREGRGASDAASSTTVTEPGRLEPARELDLMVVDVLAEAVRRAITIGRFRSRATSITDPTPACVTTARASRM